MYTFHCLPSVTDVLGGFGNVIKYVKNYLGENMKVLLSNIPARHAKRFNY